MASGFTHSRSEGGRPRAERRKLTVVAPRVTNELIARYIAEGRGFGHGEAYKAFIQLMRWNASPVSVQTFGNVPPFHRDMHFLCRSEWLISLLLAWAGCHVREQFPMWPWPSQSPLYGLHSELDSKLPWTSGTLALCQTAGIDHGCFVGTTIPYVWTMDLVVTLAWLPPEEALCALVSIKPLQSEKYTGDIDPVARGPEKLEVERRYAKELGWPYFLADRSLFPGPLLGQLELYASAASLPANHVAKTAQEKLLDRYGELLAKLPPLEWRDRLVTDHGLTMDDADLAVHNILWTQAIDVDLTQEIQMEDPIRPGGRALRETLRRHILEASHV